MTVTVLTFAALYKGSIDESGVERLLLAEAGKPGDIFPDVDTLKKGL
ncbi:MAG: hypothetical protein ACI89U_000156 [Gammaproteobacteria bacterium]|jgi:hypothetical protein